MQYVRLTREAIIKKPLLNYIMTYVRLTREAIIIQPLLNYIMPYVLLTSEAMIKKNVAKLYNDICTSNQGSNH